jgi:hypothetical protein
MQVILKEEISTSAGNIKVGTMLDLPDYLAQEWIQKGKARPVSKIEKAVNEPPEKRREHGIKANNSTGR